MNTTQQRSDWRWVYQELTTGPLSRRAQYLALAAILLAILSIRLVHIDTPALQYTSWKEIDYLTISQNYWQHGFNLFRPEVTWPAEPPRVTEMELPLVPYTTAWLFELFGYSVFTARAVTLFAFLLLIVYVFKLAKRELGPVTALIAALIAGVLPLYHPFGNMLFSEPAMIAMSVVSVYYLAEWVEHERRRDGLIALAALSLTFALKIETLYLFLPVAWIAFRKYGWAVRRYAGLAALSLAALVLPALWYSYAYYLENTGAHLFGIFLGHNKSQTLTMLTQFRWYRTMAGRVINGILGGPFGTLLVLVGILAAARLRKAGLFAAYLVAVLIYFGLVAEGNIDVPYRQMTIIPPLAVFGALGAQAVFAWLIVILRRVNRAGSLRPDPRTSLMVSAALVAIIPLLKINAVLAPDAPAHPDRWVLAQVIKQTSAPADKLVVIGEYTKHVGGYDLSPVLYYYSDRQGWSLTPPDWRIEKIEELRARGAALLVVVNRYDYAPLFVNYQPEVPTTQIIDAAWANYPVLYENGDQIIFDLR